MRTVITFNDEVRAVFLECIGDNTEQLLDEWSREYREPLSDSLDAAKNFVKYVNGFYRKFIEVKVISYWKKAKPDLELIVRCAPGEGLVIVKLQEEH